MNPPAALAAPALLPPPSRYGDTVFRWITVVMAFSLIALVVLVGWELWHGSQLAREKFGGSFLTSSEWDPVQEKYGALPFIFGTLVSSLIALGIAIPLSIGTAIFLTEMAPTWMR